MTNKYDSEKEPRVAFSALITVYARNIISSYAKKHQISESAVLEKMADLLVADGLQEPPR